MAKVTGAKAHAARLKRISGPEMVKQVGAALYAAGDAIKVEAQISITNGAQSGKSHVASLPGQAPKNDTGTLAGNIETTLVGPLLVNVTSAAPYAAALEYGTSKMAARPYMAPAVARKRKEVTAAVRDAVITITRGSKGRGGGE